MTTTLFLLIIIIVIIIITVIVIDVKLYRIKELNSETKRIHQPFFYIIIKIVDGKLIWPKNNDVSETFLRSYDEISIQFDPINHTGEAVIRSFGDGDYDDGQE